MGHVHNGAGSQALLSPSRLLEPNFASIFYSLLFFSCSVDYIFNLLSSFALESHVTFKVHVQGKQDRNSIQETHKSELLTTRLNCFANGGKLRLRK